MNETNEKFARAKKSFVFEIVINVAASECRIKLISPKYLLSVSILFIRIPDSDIDLPSREFVVQLQIVSVEPDSAGRRQEQYESETVKYSHYNVQTSATVNTFSVQLQQWPGPDSRRMLTVGTCTC